MDIDHPTKPRMPWIKHLYGFRHMGFATLACTLLTARNAAAAAERDQGRQPFVKRAARP
jgi:hypothetical protein